MIVMDVNEFEGFQLILKRHFAERISGNFRFHLCQISDSTILVGRESELMKRAVPKRVNEFAAGRMCARKCLSFLGVENFEILRGEFGEPLWPDGTTGSITHHAGMAIAVSMLVNQGYIGIDFVDLSEDLTNPAAVLNDTELEIEISEDLQNNKLLLFSLKESVIKIMSPLLQEYVEFKDIEIEFDNNLWKVDFREEFLNIELFWFRHGQYAFTTAILKI
jgi:4'-phosphopantetheinyl transferase EntD